MVNGTTHGITFGNYHSIDDWGLYLTSYPVISPAEVKENYKDIEGRDGSLDFTEQFGRVFFYDRSFDCELTMLDEREDWEYKYSQVQNAIHGQKMHITLDNDKSHYWEGRLTVSNWQPKRADGIISIHGRVGAYKNDTYSSLDDWLWDPFDFEHDIVRDYGHIPVHGKVSTTIVGSRKPVQPVFMVKTESEIVYSHVSEDERTGIINGVVLKNGNVTSPDITYYEGEIKVTLEGEGEVSILYRGGSL